MGFRAQILHHPFVEDEHKQAESREAERFDSWVGSLPAADLEFARLVYTALAGSSSTELRSIVAVRIQLLYRLDKQAALPLWRQLIDDPEEENSDHACEGVELEIEEGRLTEGEAAHLLAWVTAARDRWFLRDSGVEP